MNLYYSYTYLHSRFHLVPPACSGIFSWSQGLCSLFAPLDGAVSRSFSVLLPTLLLRRWPRRHLYDIIALVRYDVLAMLQPTFCLLPRHHSRYIRRCVFTPLPCFLLGMSKLQDRVPGWSWLSGTLHLWSWPFQTHYWNLSLYFVVGLYFCRAITKSLHWGVDIIF